MTFTYCIFFIFLAFLVAFLALASPPPEAQVTDLLVGFLLLSLPGKFTIKFTVKNKINLRIGQIVRTFLDILDAEGWVGDTFPPTLVASTSAALAA